MGDLWWRLTSIPAMQMVLVSKPVPCKYFSGIQTETHGPAIEMANAISAGTGSTIKDERKDYTDKSDPIREHDCIWCMACVSVCPPQAIKVDQSNLEFHEKAA